MTHDEFNGILESRIEKIRETLGKKAQEYASYEDRLHNFKRAGEIGRTTSKDAWKGMWLKHVVSLLDMVMDDTLTRDKYGIDVWEEKIGDTINYLILLEGLVKEGRVDAVVNMEGGQPVGITATYTCGEMSYDEHPLPLCPSHGVHPQTNKEWEKIMRGQTNMTPAQKYKTWGDFKRGE
jgi:hypothetical protein